MKHNSENCRSNCPINFVLETFGDKWTLLIVRDLMFKGKKHYGEFLQSDENIATNILANRLKRLENHGIVTRSADPANAAKRLYSLTAKGKDLLPVMLEITAWSAKHDTLTNTPKEFSQRLKVEKEAIAAEVQSMLD